MENIVEESYIFTVACIENDTLWFVTDGTHILCRMDIKSHIVHFCCILPHPSKNIRQLIGAIVIDNNKVIMAPLEGEEYLIYNIKTGKLKTYICEMKESCKFYRAIQYKNKIFFISLYEAGLAEYDTNSEEFVYHKEFQNEKQCEVNGINTWSSGDGYVYDNYIYIPLIQNNNILKINLDTYKFSFITLDNYGTGYNALACIHKDCWAIPKNGGIIKKCNYSLEKQAGINQTKTYLFKESDRIVWNQKEIYILDSEELFLYRFEIKSEVLELTKFDVKNKNDLQKYVGHKILWAGDMKDDLFFLTSDGKFLMWNKHSEQCYTYSFLIDKNDSLRESFLNIIWKPKVLIDWGILLRKMVKYMPKHNHNSDIIKQETIGRGIYDFIGNIDHKDESKI